MASEASTGPRVLHITLCDDGGVARAIQSIIDNTTIAEHQLVVPRDWKLETTGRQVHRLQRTGPAVFSEIHALIRKIGPDVVHVHSSWAGMYVRIARIPVPVVYQAHGYAHDDVNRGRLGRPVYKMVERLLSARTDVVAVVSERERRLALALNGSTPVEMIPNVASAGLNRAGIAVRSHPNVVKIGRMVPQKSPEFFADVARAVRRLDPAVQFTWIGGADEGSPYPPLLEAAGVHITGWVSQSQVSDELAAADLYIHTSSSEGFPLSVLEAANHGVPVLVRQIPAFEGSGLLTFDSVDDAAHKVVKAVREPEVKADLTERSARLDAAHTPEAQGRGAAEAYRIAIAGRAAGRRRGRGLAARS